ncbi:WD40 repeat-like protein [Polyplosphaeria fusca]|uniref:WD40 repeat-like protein n=1 Tax=Polyplosphaeria fusca TaxID=682080 RepID=A0A9P4RD53_9PLEO|nr:WD40 repeat-like protein [Polyplosphaeria fusca]
MLPSAVELVANFLRSHGYKETLATFIKEANLPGDIGASSNSDITVENVLQEKLTFDLSRSFEKLGVDDKAQGWTSPAPSIPSRVQTLPAKSNLLSVHVFDVQLHCSSEPQLCIVATTADRCIHFVDPIVPSSPLLHSISDSLDSPVLDIAVLKSRYLLTSFMSGRLVLYDPATRKILDERRDHKKYVVKLTTWSEGPVTMVASAAWDSRIHLYRMTGEGTELRLGDPIASATLSTVPETIQFICPPSGSGPLLLLSRRDSSFLYYYDVPTAMEDNFEMHCCGKQNLAPRSNAWVAFTPSDVKICPNNPSVVAVATSSTPYMKLLVVQMLIPPRSGPKSDAQVQDDPDSNLETSPGTQTPNARITQASQAQDELLLQNREEAAIHVNISTLSPQTTYSTPKLAWRPDGSGIYVSSDDGVIRGFEASTGKFIESLQGHEPGSKIRCLVSGTRASNDDTHPRTEEFLVTGGFDQNLILWKIH